MIGSALKRVVNNSGNNRDNRIPDLAAVLLCAFALFRAIETTGDLNWPYDLDQFREIGMAQSVLDHRYGTDHLYAGETIWYNPLTSTVVAALSHVTGVPVDLIVTRAGAYLNLLWSIAFYILVAYLFDRWTALAALVAFLFAPIGDAPSWAAASYSPWLFSQNFAQGIFYLGLVSYAKALRSTSWRWYGATGILLGLTFLGHTAPAVLLGIIIPVAALTNSIARGKDSRGSWLGANEIRGLIIIFSTAFIVSLPFTFSILLHYHLRVVNSVPGNWVYPSLVLNQLGSFLRSFFSWFPLVALVGLVGTIKLGSHRYRRILLLTWLVISCLALAVNEIQQAISPDLHLMFVPAHHFLFYLQALEDIFFGVGLVVLARSCADLLPKMFTRMAAQPKRQHLKYWGERMLIGAGILSFIVLVFSSYRQRFDYTNARDQAIGFQERKDYLDAYRWILANTRPDDVFLSLSGDLDLSIVGPADRKTLVTCQPEFSNPYLSWKSRSEAATKIVDKLAHAAPDAREALFAAHVNYIITVPMEQFDRPPFSFLSKEFAKESVAIYKVSAD